MIVQQKKENRLVYLYKADGNGLIKELSEPYEIPSLHQLADDVGCYMRVINISDMRNSMRFNPIQLKYIPTFQDAITYSDNLLSYFWENAEGAPQYFKLYQETSVNFLAACIFFFVNYKRLPYDNETGEELVPEYHTDKETGHKKLTGNVFDKNGNPVPPNKFYWLGKYSDMPHVLAFLNLGYKTMFDVLETDNEVFPLIAPYRMIYRNREDELLDLSLLPLRTVLCRFQTKEMYWVLHKDGDDFDLSVPLCRDYLMLVSKESQRKLLNIISLLIGASVPTGKDWDCLDKKFPWESYNTILEGENIRPYRFSSKEEMEKILYANYDSVKVDVDNMIEEIIKEYPRSYEEN